MEPVLVNNMMPDAHLSPLMKAKAKTALGGVVNACPFGCREEDLTNELGYCRHLKGFTRDGKTFEPIKARNTKSEHLFVDGSDPQKVLKTDKLIPITDCSRVYRDDSKAEVAKNGG